MPAATAARSSPDGAAAAHGVSALISSATTRGPADRAWSRRNRHPVERGAHEIFEVRSVELLAHVLRRIAERRFEALQRLAATFDVREVRREHAHVVAGLLDDPADIFGRVRRGADLAAHVVARL